MNNQLILQNDPSKNLVNEIVKMNNDAVECMSVKKFPLSQASELLLRALSMSVNLPTNICKSLQELNTEYCCSSSSDGIGESALPKSNNNSKHARRPPKRSKISCTKNLSSSSVSNVNDNEDSSSSSSSPSKNSCVRPDEYDEGMNMYPNPLQVPDIVNDTDLGFPSVLAALLFNLGQINLQRNEDDVALRFFLLAHDVCASDNGSVAIISTHEEIAIIHNIGYIYYRKRKYDLALEQFTRVYNVSSEKFGLHDLSVAAALNCIGVVLFHMRDAKRDDIQDILFQSLSIRKHILSFSGNGELYAQDANVATTLNNIGRVYFDSGKFDKAQEYYQQSLTMRRSILGPDHLDVSATAFNAGQTYHKLGLLDEAIHHYQEFYHITANKLGCNHGDVVVVLKHLGQAFHEKQDNKQACNYYQEALHASRQVTGHFNREAASILNMLGNLHYESGNFDKAVEVYEEGLLVERVVLQHNCINIVVTLSNIGQALMQKGDYTLALTKYTEAHSIQSTFPEKNTKKITETLSIIGQISSMLGKYAQAQKAFTEVVSMRRQTLGDHVDVALALNYLGLVNFKQGALDLAMENFEESLRVRKVCCAEDSGDIAVLLYNIASIYLHRGDNDMALKYYQDALTVERATLGHSHPDVAVTLKLIGKVYDQCGQFEEALGYYTDALDIYKKASSDENVETSDDASQDYKLNAGRLLALMASIYLRQANTEQMTETLSEAHRIYRDVGAPMEELELAGFNLYELSMLHPECAPAA